MIAGNLTLTMLVLMLLSAPGWTQAGQVAARTYPVVDTGQTVCFDADAVVACPAPGEPFRGQDAQHTGNQPSYLDNGDGTVTDLVTGLTWSQSPDLNGDGVIDVNDKRTYAEALAAADGFELAGYHDWRLPTIKELYSLIEFDGVDPTTFTSVGNARPFIDTDVFAFAYGDTSAGDRIIDAQFASSTLYVSTTMGGNRTMFGVNFADGRIKGYPATGKGFYVLYVRGGQGYGQNDLVDNGDGTVTDRASGLMWAQDDSGKGMSWETALAWVEQLNAERYLGYRDWRLPDAKELESLVDYSRAPDITASAAIDPVLDCTAITNEAGQVDYPYYWTSTTHVRDGALAGSAAVYVAFGRAMGYMRGRWMDVHGAGAQRSDPKSGDPAAYPYGRGPQGDAIRILNFVRPVRDAAPSLGQVPTSSTIVPELSTANGAGAETVRTGAVFGDLPGTDFSHSAGPPGTTGRAERVSGPPTAAGHDRQPPQPPVELVLDRDGDGIIDGAELAGAEAALATLDRDGDGQLSRDECLPPRPAGRLRRRALRPSAPPVLAALDANGDGSVTADELAGATIVLLTLDRNHDGRLTPDEYRPRRPAGAGRRGGEVR